MSSGPLIRSRKESGLWSAWCVCLVAHDLTDKTNRDSLHGTDIQHWLNQTRTSDGLNHPHKEWPRKFLLHFSTCHEIKLDGLTVWTQSLPTTSYITFCNGSGKYLTHQFLVHCISTAGATEEYSCQVGANQVVGVGQLTSEKLLTLCDNGWILDWKN